MSDAKGIPTVTPRRRGRPRKTESFAAWMARIDAEVSAKVRQVEKEPPLFADLHPAQRKIVLMMIEHLRSLPRLQPGESPWGKREYRLVNTLLGDLFEIRYPEWKLRNGESKRFITDLPHGEGQNFEYMLKYCAGAPISSDPLVVDEDDDEQ